MHRACHGPTFVCTVKLLAWSLTLCPVPTSTLLGYFASKSKQGIVPRPGTIHSKQLQWGLLWSTGVKACVFLRIKPSDAGSDWVFFYLVTRIAVPFIVGFFSTRL